MQKVAVESCTDYDIDTVKAAVNRLFTELDTNIKRDSTVLIKPNIMAQNKPTQHTVTHYTVIDAICAYLADKSCRIQIGDSIAFFQKGLTRKAFTTTKLSDVAKKYNARLVAFDEEPLTKITAQLTVFKQLYIPRILLEADVIINACKLKTHGGGLRFSGAVKNVFGCLPGGYKQKAHIWVKSDFELSDLFIDIMQTIKPALHIMDAIVGLDGGPSALGKPTPVGALLASRNPAALDAVACRMIGYKPEQIAILVRAKERGLITDFATIKILGTVPRVQFRKLIKTPLPAHKTKDSMFVTDTFVYPVVKKSKCSGCRDCLDFCPTGAIQLDAGGKASVNYEKCVFCYYCLAACKERAISFKSSLGNKLIRLMRWMLGF
ncbi:MAG: DUF362 domain-containing protein [Spirochaetales bacterium]|nr:DUF362 domain-containing protein [Spirochaetales bacterium]